MAVNLVEMIQAEDADCAFDQPCKFGHRVECHAIYCHNDAWDNAPRKCRRSAYTGGEVKDEDCPGFQPNPAFKDGFNPTPITGPLCSQCGGSKLVIAERGKSETCPRCMGDGAEPHAVEMSQYEQGTLEMGHTIAPRPGERFVGIAENAAECESIYRLDEMNLVVIRSVSWVNKASVFLLESTAKGHAVMRANWAKAKERTDS